MFHSALPFWADHGPDKKYGGFIEELDFSGNDAELPHKRTRVTCRQVYVFSHAKLLGFEGVDALIERGGDYLANRAWLGSDGGFARRLTRQGEVLDPTPDLYDHAFALFAFAWAYRATSEAEYRVWAHRVLDWIEAHLREGNGEGFWHELPPKGWRLQNPHMHLLEACLAAFEATGDTRFEEVAREIVQLFQNRFFNRKTGALTEYFNDNWVIADAERGRVTEPGHQLEWAWILKNCSRLLDVNADDEIRALVRFSETYGLNAATGAVMNSVRDDGVPIDRGSRIWPNTERLKAAIALYELDGADPRPVITATCRVLFNHYLTSSPEIEIPGGTWIDAFDGDGRPQAERIPASTFYHLFLAFAEILRVEDGLVRAT